MTGSLLLALMGLAQGVWQVAIPRWSYLAVTGCFLTWAFYRTWLKEHRAPESISSTRTAEVMAVRDEKQAEIAALSDRITELSRKPYSEDLERCVNQVLDQMTYQGWLLLRHLLMRERLDVGREFMPGDIPVDTQSAQMGILMSGGIVKHDVVWRGSSADTYYVINQQFRPTLEGVLYERLKEQQR